MPKMPGKRCARGTRHTGFYESDGNTRKCSTAGAKSKTTGVNKYDKVKKRCAPGFKKNVQNTRCNRK